MSAIEFYNVSANIQNQINAMFDPYLPEEILPSFNTWIITQNIDGIYVKRLTWYAQYTQVFSNLDELAAWLAEYHDYSSS